MLHYNDYEWRLAQPEYERLVAAMRAAAHPAPAECASKHSRSSLRWVLGHRSGVDGLASYLRSELTRPYVRVSPMPHSDHNDRILSTLR